MNDGEDDYPNNEITALLENYRSLIERFWAVALDEIKMEILKPINQIMDSSFLNIKESIELISTYAETAHIFDSYVFSTNAFSFLLSSKSENAFCSSRRYCYNYKLPLTTIKRSC